MGAVDRRVLVQGTVASVLAPAGTAEFDRGDGIWRALADKHPLGIPRGLLGEVRVRDMLERHVRWTRQQIEEDPSSSHKEAHARAVASLAEFERGEGLWRYAVKAAPDDI